MKKITLLNDISNLFISICEKNEDDDDEDEEKRCYLIDMNKCDYKKVGKIRKKAFYFGHKKGFYSISRKHFFFLLFIIIIFLFFLFGSKNFSLAQKNVSFPNSLKTFFAQTHTNCSLVERFLSIV